MLARIKCAWRGIHDPLERHPLGGWRCKACFVAGASLDELGYENGGWVPPQRRVYDRKHGILTRTQSWEPDSRRGW